MGWEKLWLPLSATISPSKLGIKRFSKQQTIVAALHWFSNLPLSLRVQIAREFENQEKKVTEENHEK
jgi:hypothetical protein